MADAVRNEYSIHFLGIEQPDGSFRYHSKIQPVEPGLHGIKNYDDLEHMAHTVNPFLDEGGDIRNTLNDWVHKTHGWQRPLWLTNDEAALFRD